MRRLRAILPLVLLSALLLTGTAFGTGPLAGDIQHHTPSDQAPGDPAAEGDTWLIMLYQDADDDVLEQDIFIDLNEAEIIGSTDQVHIVVQLDRYKGGFTGDGDWTNTKRFHLTQDGDLEHIASPELEDVSEQAMSMGDTLVDFVVWAAGQYPADKYVLILSDHGMGWVGGWTDPDPLEPGKFDLAMTLAKDHLYLMEMDEALGKAREQAGIDRFELIGLDACLMAQLEVLSALAPHARYAVVSEETEPGLGWAYAGLLERLVRNTSMTGRELAEAIVDSYIVEDIRLVDPRARIQMLLQSMDGADLAPEEAEEIEEWKAELDRMSPEELDAEMTAEEMIEQHSRDITLTGVDLDAVPGVVDALDSLARELTGVDQKNVAQARTYAQSFANVFGDDVPPHFIDLGNFAELLAEETGEPAVSAAVEQLVEAIEDAVVAEKHGAEKPGATGISIYFPNSDLFGWRDTGLESYTVIANRFAASSLWDNFLLHHYTGAPLPDQPTEAVPPPQEPAAEKPAPGAGEIEIEPLQLASDEASLDEPAAISTGITGDNIAYVYLFVSLYEEESNRLLVADMDFVGSDENKEVGGTVYPDWDDENTNHLEFEWEPVLYAINDGENSEFALLEPQMYGRTAEEAVYTVDGIYEFANGGDPRYSELYFTGEGILRQVYGYTNLDGTGAQSEITPAPGDRFTILEQWARLDDEAGEVEFSEVEGGTLTFGLGDVYAEEIPAPPGEYNIGLIAEDLDGNYYGEYAPVLVVD